MNNVTNDIYYVGVNDHLLDMFEGQYEVPNGMAYNSYIIMDEKIAIFDSVDIKFFDEWYKNIKEVLGNRKPDYLIVQHMEPDHSANIMRFFEEYPETTLVINAQALRMLNNFFHKEPSNKLIVNNDQELNLGKHTLHFVFAPMVHWPEVMMTYDMTDKVLFSADAFGKFGALDVNEDWACEARRYYFGIVGKYGVQVQNVLKKLAGFEIKSICPLHGPILNENLGYYLNLYDIWSRYDVEADGVFIAYTSVYGHTKEAAYLLKEELEKAGCPKVSIADLARDSMSEAVEDAFKYGKVVLATTTYNMEIFPFMSDFVTRLLEHGYQNRKIGIIENGTWAPQVEKILKAKFANAPKIEIVEPVVKIVSAMNDTNKEQIKALAEALK